MTSLVIEATTSEELDRLISADAEVVIVDFAAESWCAPCRALKPHYDALSNMMPSATFVHVDIDKADGRIMSSYEIMAVPTVLLFSYGKFKGALNARTVVALHHEIQAMVGW